VKEMNKMIEKQKIEDWIKDFNEKMTYFCKKINWKTSFLDADAIQFMNSSFGIKGLKEILK